ncbi:MAG: CopG family ribbon-helix-helix protein [Anaerolineae bacterium]
MRTTIRLDDDLLAEIKQIAARTDRTLTSVIEDALREMLARQQKAEERAPVRLTTVRGSGLQPGVDLDDSAALLSLMEESGDPA